MIPTAFEYLVVNVVLACLTLAILGPELKEQVRTLAFWVGLGSFLVACFVLDLAGLKLGWWTFPPDRNVQLLIVGLPVEEFLLYALIYVLAVCSWELEAL